MYSALLLLLAAVPAFAADCARQYTVKEGDFCDSISAAQNSSTYQLAVVNSDSINPECTNLGIGQSICLGSQGEDCQATHVVSGADICDSIMSTYNINATMLWTNNPNINEDCTNIYEGEVLCVSNQVQVPPAPASGIPTPMPSAAPASTSEAPSPTIANPAAAPTDSSEDGSDEDLPFCDEIEDDDN